MPTQTEIAKHLGMTQQAVSAQMAALSIDWRTASLGDIRLRYLDRLRAACVVAGGGGLAYERAMTEQVDRELREIQVAEKRSQLINLDQLRDEIARMVETWREELRKSDAALRAEIEQLYGIQFDADLLHRYAEDAFQQLHNLTSNHDRKDHP